MTKASAPPDLPALDGLDWSRLSAQLDDQGFALTPPLLDARQCAEAIAGYDRDELYRSTIVMSRHSFGEGSYRYFADPLPPVVQSLRERLYPPLAHIANGWAALLGEGGYAEHLTGLHADCADAGQHRPTPLVLRYGPGGYNCLHQDVYGDVTFPLQVAIMLSTPDEDFTGGENVFVEQRPRAQSRPLVARPGLGEGMIFAVRNRPRRGARGYHRVTLRHGVSTVHSGQRYALGIIFHNAR